MKRNIRRKHEKRLTKKRIKQVLMKTEIKLTDLSETSFNKYQKQYKHQSVPCSCSFCSHNKFKRKKYIYKYET